ENAKEIFSGERLLTAEIKTYATPRRLALIAEVSAVQMPSEKEVWGPPVNVSFDNKGNPTKAAEAFAKAQGVDIKDLLKKEKGKGVYLVAMVSEGARDTNELMPEIVQKIITSLNFPKSMRWGYGNIRFARPIHWILALYNNKRINFELDGLKSGSLTKGHRFLSPGSFEVKDAGAYISLLRSNYVILDPDERTHIIIKQMTELASSVDAVVVPDEGLLEHVSFLVEYPTLVLGSFPEEYLSIPRELLTTVMRGHQKYFALEDKEGRLANYFIIVSNTRNENADIIRRGAEKVIKARFEDARFYYEQDKTVTLKERLEGLRKVIYHERLGSLYDKVVRISSIAEFISDRLFKDKKDDIRTAAIISKSDLISGVVREFPELQGVIGGYYALNDGYGSAIAAALPEQYLPAHSGDKIPASDIGAAISLADKLDNLTSFFMLGLTPTGNEDPFALRRQALGIVLILVQKRYGLSISDGFGAALRSLNIEQTDAIMADLITFFEQRIESLFLSRGYGFDAVNAVMSFVKDRPLYSVLDRLDSIQMFKKDSDYDTFLLAIKRINNIAPKSANSMAVDAGLFRQDEEEALYRAVVSLQPHIDSFVTDNKYYDALRALTELTDIINNFFDKVLVMDKDESVKNNRLALIKKVQSLTTNIADFSRLS
ncbi:MAG: glycine--tRNA ligase subunit beta, partial [Nitrospirae bacterium]|nr:glycine--tRNA ligase subunit beta [Nitrospirota bacterium]